MEFLFYLFIYYLLLFESVPVLQKKVESGSVYKVNEYETLSTTQEYSSYCELYCRWKERQKVPLPEEGALEQDKKGNFVIWNACSDLFKCTVCGQVKGYTA